MPSQELSETTTTTPADRLPYRVLVSESTGRFLVASRDLSPGELIMREEPLVVGPCAVAKPVCLGCYNPVELDSSQYRCPECQWPMCSSECAGLHQSRGHTVDECRLLAERVPIAAKKLTASADDETVKNLYELIVILRILGLKTKSDERSQTEYAAILQMESHAAVRRQNETLQQYYDEFVVERLRVEWGLQDVFSEQEINTVCGILDVNCFEIGQNDGASARALFPHAFLFEHNCVPNTAHTDIPGSYELMVRTTVTVRKNTILSVNYAFLLQGTLKRRDLLHGGKLFWCSCARCADPTELGTDCSALVCPMCAKGSVRTADPSDQGSDWTCDKCGFRMSGSTVSDDLDTINNELEGCGAHNVPAMEAFIVKFSKVLRPNHYLLLSAKYLLCQLYGRIDGYIMDTLSTEDTARKERYCRELLAFADILEPGKTRLRATIMYELHAPILVAAQKAFVRREISAGEFQRRVHEVKRLLETSRDILLLEPPGTADHEMGVAAHNSLQQLNGAC